jgi:hypothetical protein
MSTASIKYGLQKATTKYIGSATRMSAAVWRVRMRPSANVLGYARQLVHGP